MRRFIFASILSVLTLLCATSLSLACLGFLRSRCPIICKTKTDRWRIWVTVPLSINKDVDLVLPGDDIGDDGKAWGGDQLPIDPATIGGDVDQISNSTQITVGVRAAFMTLFMKLYKVSISTQGQQIEEVFSSVVIPYTSNFQREYPWALDSYAVDQLALIRTGVLLGLRLDCEIGFVYREEETGLNMSIRRVEFYRRDGSLHFIMLDVFVYSEHPWIPNLRSDLGTIRVRTCA